jgi:hypothetical protein
MYHLEVNFGESPGLSTVKATPLELYVGFPFAVKLSEAPCVKSMLTDFPSAESGGHGAERRGSQFAYVVAKVILVCKRAMTANDDCDSLMLGTGNCEKLVSMSGVEMWVREFGVDI